MTQPKGDNLSCEPPCSRETKLGCITKIQAKEIIDHQGLVGVVCPVLINLNYKNRKKKVILRGIKGL
jgi:hypothetical protein